MNTEMYDRLNETENYHWWFKAKREIVLELAKRYLIPENTVSLRLADVGCGTGLFLHELEKYGDVDGYDYSEHALEYCKMKCNATLHKLDLGIVASWLMPKYDVVFALDILEHIKDDSIALSNIYRMTKPGGHIIITVPAFQWMWSTNDINNMHHRRYSLSDFLKLIDYSGFEIVFSSYYNFWLFLPIAFIRLFSNWLHIDKHSSMEYNSGNGLLNHILYKIFVGEKKHLTKQRSYPFGVSIIAVLEKRENHEKN
ncbi:MAG: class I SAM-dependent methyltransferase [Lachnospiraceae bacterium]|nr:class I SAM-dependent methyltransferase [Lachnospiraceae bacterium]